MIKIENKFKSNFSKKLKELNINEREFINSLKSVNGVISGSFILQCILDEYWSSDLDVYINSTLHGNAFFHDLYNKFDSDKNKVTLLHDYIYQHDNLIKNDKFDFGLQKLLINNVNMDLIFIKDDYETFIYNKFDFDFCKNFYDGNELHIYDINTINNKKCYVKSTKFFKINTKLNLINIKKHEYYKNTQLVEYEPYGFEEMEYSFLYDENDGYYCKNIVEKQLKDEEIINKEKIEEERKKEIEKQKIVTKEVIKYKKDIKIIYEITCRENLNIMLVGLRDKLNLEKINEKNIEIKINYDYFKRIKKYQDRGFDIFINIIHNAIDFNILSIDDMNKNINKEYLSEYNKKITLSKELYEEICGLFVQKKEPMR